MHLITLIFAGVAMGFGAALPIGPVNLLCIRRTLAFGSLNGFLTGLGAALGDGIFAAVTGFGLTFLAELIEGHKSILELIGGTLLVFFGYRAFTAKPHARDAEGGVKQAGRASLPGAIFSTFALAITNPATLLGFTAMFAGLNGLIGDTSFFGALLVVAGVLGGSTLWWLTLSAIIGTLHHSITDRTMELINKSSGGVIALFGLGVLVHVLTAVL